jgi:UPF0271 protein
MHIKNTIDINVDLGEGFPNDRHLLELATSASISCGAHAGNPDSITAAILAAVQNKVAIGAHPGYPDPSHFGRRPQIISTSDLTRLILDQCETLRHFAERFAAPIVYLKPHGALYNQAQSEPEIARGIAAAAAILNLPVMTLPNGLLAQQLTAHHTQIRAIPEGFADRRYGPNGLLVPRSEPNATLADPHEIEAQIVRLIRETHVETLCIHGDDPHAVENAKRLRNTLASLQIQTRAAVEHHT